MKKLTRKIVALTLSLVMCISFSNTTFAYADNENISSSAEASKVNWWKIGWIILSDYVEKLIDLDGQSEKDSSWAYLVSPSIEYNTGDMGPEVYFRPEVDNSVGSIRMHGHRIIFVDIFTQIALILSDASGDTVSQATTGTNQYMFYTKKAGDSSGTWKAQFVSTETYKWQLYYAHYYNANARSSVPMTEDGFYFGDNNRVYQFSVAESYRLNSLPPEVVDMTQLNAQFINPADGKTVDYLKDFNAGDQVHFSDIIIDISYDATEDATTFYFTEDTYEENIGWKFAGNLLDQYSAGDVLNLTFDVLNVGNYQGITFESLDYFEAAYAHNNGAAYPNIQDVELSMAAGFNGARLHQKVFEPLFLYHCDKAGYLVSIPTPVPIVIYTLFSRPLVIPQVASPSADPFTSVSNPTGIFSAFLKAPTISQFAHASFGVVVI